MLTEEEQIERLGTDSDGTPIDLKLRPPSLKKASFFDLWVDEILRGPPKKPDFLRQKLREGYRVNAPKQGPDGARIYRVRFPVNLP